MKHSKTKFNETITIMGFITEGYFFPKKGTFQISVKKNYGTTGFSYSGYMQLNKQQTLSFTEAKYFYNKLKTQSKKLQDFEYLNEWNKLQKLSSTEELYDEKA